MNSFTSVAGILILFLRCSPAFPAPVEITQCGQILDTDAFLAADLVCDSGAFEDKAIIVGTSGIDVDLGGHKVSGHPLGIGIGMSDVEGVTVRNGVIENFLVAVDVFASSNVTFRDLTVRNLVEDDPDHFVPGLRLTRSDGVVIRDSGFEFLPVAHKEAIVLADTEVVIDNIEMTGGSVGVNISGDSGEGNLGSIAAVTNSRFEGVTIAGVLVQFTRLAQIENNEFVGCEKGVMVDLHAQQSPDGISNVHVRQNSFHDGYIGVHFMGVTDSSVERNDIRNNWRGVFLDANMGCPDPPNENCVFSSGNFIANNIALGNFVDLFHHEFALGNTWVDNKCWTKEGAEIPECTTIWIDGFETYPLHH